MAINYARKKKHKAKINAEERYQILVSKKKNLKKYITKKRDEKKKRKIIEMKKGKQKYQKTRGNKSEDK